MVKALRAFSRAPGMEHEEFLRRWEQHGALVLAVPGVRGYAQSHRVGREEDSTAPFDGFSSIWFDDEEAAARAGGTPEAAAVREDRATFADMAGSHAVLADEHVQHDLPLGSDAVKLVFFFRRRVGLSPEVFRRHWLEVHGPLVVEYITGLRRLVQNAAVESSYDDGGEPDFDGLAEAYVADLSTLEETEESPEHDLVRSDEPNFVDVNRVTHMVCAERVLRGPETA